MTSYLSTFFRSKGSKLRPGTGQARNARTLIPWKQPSVNDRTEFGEEAALSRWCITPSSLKVGYVWGMFYTVSQSPPEGLGSRIACLITHPVSFLPITYFSYFLSTVPGIASQILNCSHLHPCFRGCFQGRGEGRAGISILRQALSTQGSKSLESGNPEFKSLLTSSSEQLNFLKTVSSVKWG